MRLTRRGFAVAGLTLGAGCLSGGSNVRYPGGAAAEGEPLVEEGGETAAATDDAGQAPPNPDLAPLTRGIHGEVRWFATGYEAAVDDYLEAVERALATVERVRDQGDLNGNTLDVVDRGVERLLSTVRSRVEPHFNITGYVENETGRHLEVARTFADRGDIDRAQEELGRLASFLENVSRRTFVNRNLSRDPVSNRLLSYLRVSEQGDVEETPGELFEVWDGETGFATYVYGGPSRIADEEASRGAFDAEDRSRFGERFAPAVSAESEAVTYVLARRLPSRPDQPEPVVPEEYPANAVAIQSFPDVETATAARRSLIEDGPVSVEGRARLGKAEMEQVFYRSMGDVVYAYLFQTAELLVVVAPSEVAWNERIDWARGLQRTWLWTAGGAADG